MDREEAIQKWKKNVFDQGDEVDPGNDYTWTGVAIGFFIGLGFSISEAKDLESELCDRDLI